MIKLSGELTFASVNAHLETITRHMVNLQAREITLDLSDVSDCDSSALALLIEVRRLANKKQHSVVIKSLPPQIKALANFCRISELLQSN